MDLTPEQRELIFKYVVHPMYHIGPLTMHHCLRSDEVEHLRTSLISEPVHTILSAYGGIGPALSGVRIFWVKMDENNAFQVETNADCSKCIAVIQQRLEMPLLF